MRISFASHGYRRGRISLPAKIKSGKLDFSAMTGGKAKKAMSDEYVERIRAIAREDAKADKYMAVDGRFNQLMHAQTQRYVSPDRSRAIAGASRAVSRVNHLPLTGKAAFRLTGQPFGGIIYKGLIKTTAEVYDEKGQMIAGYTGYGWTSVPTRAEERFQSQSVQIYAAAYDAARAEIRASQQTQRAAGAAGLDVRA